MTDGPVTLNNCDRIWAYLSQLVVVCSFMSVFGGGVMEPHPTLFLVLYKQVEYEEGKQQIKEKSPDRT